MYHIDIYEEFMTLLGTLNFKTNLNVRNLIICNKICFVLMILYFLLFKHSFNNKNRNYIFGPEV